MGNEPRPPLNFMQCWILGIGTAALLMLSVFVPWNESLDRREARITKSIGYHPIFNAPTPSDRVYSTEVNVPMVLIPMGAVLVGMIVGTAAFANRKV